MNHAIPKGIMTPQYIGATEQTSEIAAGNMQRISDALLDVAKRYRAKRLKVVN